MKTLRTLLILGLALSLFSCGDDDGGELSLDQMSTYEVIQTQIWDTQCVSCHTAGSSFARQSDLVLTSDVSYEQLVGRSPNNAQAIEDGLELLGTEGLPSLFKSFLWEKINANDQEHFYSDHPEYGAIMPLGADFLTNGELEFIREWIINGAPKTDKVADVSLLNDDTRFEAIAFEALPLPERGYQFHIGPFDVEPNTERELFSYQSIPSEEDIFIDQVEIVMRSGSHHFIFYTFDDNIPDNIFPEENEIRDIYSATGTLNYSNLFPLQYHNFIAGTQWPRMNYKYPEGVALRIPAGKGFDMNSHYANRSNQVITGEVYGNIHTVPVEEVEHVAEVLDLNNQDFALPPNRVTTIAKEYIFNNRRHVFQLFSHAHEHMTEFKVFKVGGSNDGELVYVSFDWEHPPILELDPPLVLEPGEGLRLEATYNNDEDRTLTFGLRSTDEMMILFGAYYTD